MSKEKLMRLAGRALKRTESYQWNRGLDMPDEENYKIQYLLVKGSKNSPENAVAYASYGGEIMILYPLQEDRQPIEINEDVFFFDSELFEALEQGYSVAFMSLESHCCIWYEIENLQDKIYNGKATRADITRVTKRLGDDISGVYGFFIPKQRQPNEQAR